MNQASNPKDAGLMERRFGLERHGTSIGIEVRAGVTTFVTMAYILFVNPNILQNAISLGEGANTFGQLLTATALAAAVGTALMGLLARYPFALAPGMGLNAYFTFTVVLGQGISWQVALGAVFISGITFLLLSLVGIREAILNAIPADLRIAIVAGIGLFLAFVGAQNAGLVVNHETTLVTLGDMTSAGPLLALLGIVVITVLMALKVPGAILIGIAVTTVVAMLTGAPVYQGQAFAGFTHGVVASPVWPTDLFLALDIKGALALGALDIIFVFVFVDLFDTAGTLIGLSTKAKFTDKDGRLPRAGLAFSADAIGTIAGSLVGTSTTTSYIESASGVEEGGRTGLTALVVAFLFLISIFLWPVAAAIPAAATAPALIVVGALMLEDVGAVRWSDPAAAVPAFLTIIMMPLTFSIAHGIAAGMITYALAHLLTGRFREVHWLLYVLAALLVARFVWLA